MKKLTFKLNTAISSIILIGIGVIVIALVILLDNRMNPKFQLSEMQIDENAYQQLTANKQANEVALSTEVYIGDQKLIYDQTDNTFYYSLVDGADESEAYMTLTSETNSLKDAISGNYLKAALLDGDEPQLIIYNKNQVSVSSFVTTTLPVMNINISAETVSELGLDETYAIEEYTAASMSLYDNRSDFDDAVRTTDSDIKIHMRGGTTINAPQKSYRITLLNNGDDMDKTKKEKLLGMRSDDDWILFSAYSDFEKIRTVFSMNLWEQMASKDNEWQAEVSNQYQYIELFFNGRYHGLYALATPIDNKSFDIKDGETLFKKKDWSGSEFSQDLEYVEYEDGSGVEMLPGYSIKDGDAAAYETLHELYYNLAYSQDSELIRSSCDVDNSIDLWLFYKMTQAVDNVYGTNVKNLYVATKNSETGVDGYKLLFSPWDMDQTWGNRFVDGQGSHGITSYYNSTDYDLPMEWSPVYFLQQCGDEEITEQVQQRYQELRESVLSDESLTQAIADYEADIYDSGAFERTMNRWPDGNYYDPAVKLDDFENFVLERMKYMDGYIESL